MKSILLLFYLLLSLFFFSQKKYNIFFDSNQDKIIFGKHNGKTEINGFRILINYQKNIYFIPSNIKANYKNKALPKNKIITRSELNKIILKDNQDKEHEFVVIIKKNNYYYYYYVDHMLRKIID